LLTSSADSRQPAPPPAELLQAVLSSVADYVFVFDWEGRFTYTHIPPEHSALFATPETFLGKLHDEVMPEHVHAPFKEAMRKNAWGDVARYDYWLDIDDRRRWFSVVMSPLGGCSPHCGSVAVVRETTVERSAREELAREKETLRRYLDTANTVIVVLDLGGRVQLINRRGCEILGLPQEMVIGRDWTKDFVPAKERRAVRQVARALAEGGFMDPTTFENHVVAFDGTQRLVSWHNSPLRDSNGTVTGVLASGEDVTESRVAEEALRESEERFRTLFEYAPDAYYLSDAKGTFIDGNRAAEGMIGFKREDLIGKNFLQVGLLPTKHVLAAAELLASNLRGDATGPDEFVLRRHDGSTVVAEISTYPLTLRGRRVVLGIARDVTQRREAEQALRDSEARYRALFENSVQGVFSMTMDGRFTEANQAFADTIGFPISDIVGRQVGDLTTEETARAVSDVRERVAATGRGINQFVLEIGQVRGRRRILEINVAPVRSERESPSLQGTVHDVTDRYAAEQELRASYERLQLAMQGTIEAVEDISEVRDPYTSGHQKRVTTLAVAIAHELGLAEETIQTIRMAASIHDIGKLYIPAEILSKPGKLSLAEFDLLRSHPQVAYDILSDTHLPTPVADIILQHHERVDGSGYPARLSGDAIFIEARIIAVADVVEAMSSHRPYRPALGLGAALEEIADGKGTRYDSRVAEACLGLFWEKGFTF